MSYSILVVDDQKGVRRELAYLLEEEGYVVSQAEDGKQAVIVLDKQAIDLVITDILMPEMDGLELANYINVHYPAIKVIIISGGGRFYSQNDSQTDDLLASARMTTGVQVMLKKPVASDVMLEKVALLLAEAEQERK
jgi:DNA-binding NtrC family response regulator